MKRILSILIVLLLCLSIFVGCDNKENVECKHNWVLVPSSEDEYECAECKETHLCVNPEDWERAGNLNESTAIYKCKICGSEHLITDPDSINPDNGINEHVPYDSMLNLEIIDGKFRFQRIATTPCIVYSNVPITDMTKGTMYDDRHDILTSIFQATDGKNAIMDVTTCDFIHYIYMFDHEREDIPWHYGFAICDCGSVMITNNNQFLCTIKISDNEIQTILNSLYADSSSGKRLPIVMTIAETLPSCVAFEYKDGEPYCFYGYDDDGKLYRVLWNNFDGLNEKGRIIVDHNDNIKTLSYDEYPDGGWTPQYEITAISIYSEAEWNSFQQDE